MANDFDFNIDIPSVLLEHNSDTNSSARRKNIFIILKKPPKASLFKPNITRIASFIPISLFITNNCPIFCGICAILLITIPASVRFAALKKIHANETRQKVTAILKNAGIFNFSQRGFVVLPIHWKIPCSNPQITKFSRLNHARFRLLKM